MGNYILRRIVDFIPTILVVAIIVFIITRLIPGDPAAVMLGPQASVKDIEALRESLGLNDPLYIQFFHYFSDLLTGNLGVSLTYNEPIVQLILDRFPNTLILAITALIIAFVIGVPAGIISASKQNSLLDYAVMLISLIGVSMPIFWLGVMLVLYFSVNLGWFPSTGMGDISEGIIPYFKHLILSSITLATIPMATFARITRSSMLEVISQDYIKTARAKGLSDRARRSSGSGPAGSDTVIRQPPPVLRGLPVARAAGPRRPEKALTPRRREHAGAAMRRAAETMPP